MDQLSIGPDTQQALQSLSDRDKQELNQFIVGESQKAQIQSSIATKTTRGGGCSTHVFPAIHELNSMCFKKCITGKITSGSLDRNEEPCMKNCVDRYMDANMTVIRHLEKMRTL